MVQPPYTPNPIDRIVQENIEEAAPFLLEKLLGIHADMIATLAEIPDYLQRTLERRPDFLKMVGKGNERFILHIEFQTDSHADMHKRMLVYASLLYDEYELPIRQVVLYFGSRPSVMENRIAYPGLSFQYEIIELRTLPYTLFLEGDNPAAATFAILGAIPPEKQEAVVRTILEMIRISEQKSSKVERHYTQLEILAKLRNLQQLVTQTASAMPIKYDLETDIRYLQGKVAGATAALERGIERGMEQGFEKGQEFTALRCLEQGMPVAQVAQLTGLSEARVAELQASLNRP